MPRAARTSQVLSGEAKRPTKMKMEVVQPPILSTRAISDVSFLLSSYNSEHDHVIFDHETTRGFKTPVLTNQSNYLQLP
ncbi:hypothetical protein ACTXT7_010440 [Hymenolepis weldensis]